MKLLDYQVEPSNHLINIHKSSRISVDMSDAGIGKTYIAAKLAKTLNRPTLVVCKKISIPTWDAVFLSAEIEDFFVINYEKLTMSKKQGIVQKKIRKGKKPRFLWKVPKDTLIIFDEAQAMSGENSAASRLLVSAKKQGFHIHLASATMAETPMKMFALGFALNLHHMNNWSEWLKANGCYWDEGREKDDRGFGGWKYRSASGAMVKIGDRILPKFGIRLRKEELDCFPKRTIEAELLEVSLEEVRTLAREMAKEIEAHNITKVNDKNPENSFTCILRERQELELLKVPHIVERIKADVKNGFSVCVFVNFTQTLHAIADRVGDSIQIIGGQSASERALDIKRFQDNEVHICIANIAAGGVSISLHDLHGRPRKSYISPSFSAIQVIQATDRIHRAGGQSEAHITYLCLADTAEEGVYRAVRNKSRRISELNDGDLQSPYLANNGQRKTKKRKPKIERDPDEAQANSSLLDRFF